MTFEHRHDDSREHVALAWTSNSSVTRTLLYLDPYRSNKTRRAMTLCDIVNKKNPPPTTVPGVGSRIKRYGALAAGNLAVLIGMLLVLELIGRAGVVITGIDGEFKRETFQGFGRSDPLLWWELKPGIDEEFLGVSLQTNRYGMRDSRDAIDPDAFTVMCVGDSTTFGWAIAPEDMFTAQVEKMFLSDAILNVRAYSTGVPGYTSYQNLLQLRHRLVDHDPNVVVILSSNNESRARSVSDRERGRALASQMRFFNIMKYSHFYLLLANRPDSALKESFDRQPSEGYSSNNLVDYKLNLLEMVQVCRDSGAIPILMTIPIRLRQVPVWETFDKLDETTLEFLEQATLERQKGSSLEQQMVLVRKATETQPDQFTAHWNLAQLSEENGQVDLAIRHYKAARDGDVHPDAAKPSYNKSIREVAQEENVCLVDLEQIFERSEHGEDQLFRDHCHPSVLGHELIAKSLAPAVRSALEKDL